MYKRVAFLFLILVCFSQDQYRSDFQMFDSDDNGKVELQEIVNSFPDATMENPGSYISEFFEEYDLNRDNVIEFEEYKQVRDKQAQAQQEELQKQSLQYQYEHDDF